jgi:hypothetical protein
MTIDLNAYERRMILMALVHKCIKDSIQEPATPRLIRDTWKNLVEKLKQDEILHDKMEKSVGSSIIIPGKKG